MSAPPLSLSSTRRPPNRVQLGGSGLRVLVCMASGSAGSDACPGESDLLGTGHAGAKRHECTDRPHCHDEATDLVCVGELDEIDAP